MKNETAAASAEKESGKWKPVVREYTKSILVALALALVIRAFVVQAYVIPSGSMEDTLEVGDRIMVNKFIYGTTIPFTDRRVLGLREPKRGDVIVFAYPEDPSKDFIKRVVGLPGDRVRIENKKVYVNGQPFENLHEVHKRCDLISGALSSRDNMSMLTVPPGSYFVMGDNRDNSYDSRFWGFVSRDSVKGLAFIRFWSWDQQNRQVRWGRIGRPID